MLTLKIFESRLLTSEFLKNMITNNSKEDQNQQNFSSIFDLIGLNTRKTRMCLQNKCLITFSFRFSTIFQKILDIILIRCIHRRIQNPIRADNYFYKMLHLRCLSGFWIPLLHLKRFDVTDILLKILFLRGIFGENLASVYDTMRHLYEISTTT